MRYITKLDITSPRTIFFVPEIIASFERLNPEPNAYIGRFIQVVYPGNKISELVPGFVRAYGMAAAHEDIAEIIALLFTGDSAVKSRLAKEDTELAPPQSKWHGVLRKKIEMVKEIVHKKIPEIDEQFWRDVGTPKMGDGVAYWNERGVLQKQT